MTFSSFASVVLKLENQTNLQKLFFSVKQLVKLVVVNENDHFSC